MSGNDLKMYVRIDGEPFLSRVIAYRAEMKRVHEVVWKFAKARGAIGVPGGIWGLQFERGNVPDGWKAPDRKGYSKPKKGHPDIEALAALPRLPKSRDVFGDTLIYDLRHEGPEKDSWGVGCIGWFFEGPYIGWAGDIFFAVVPDAAKAAAEHLAQYPGSKITNGADTWKLPPGLTEISKAQHDLIVATYEVEQERKARVAA